MAASGGGANYWISGRGGGGHPPGGSGAHKSYQRDSSASSFSGNGGRTPDNSGWSKTREDGTPRPSEVYRGGVHNFMNPIIEKLFRPYLDRFERVHVKSIRESVNSKQDDLPGK